MENLDDEKIQQLIEQQLRENKPDDLPGDTEEKELYRMLFKELSNNPITVHDSTLANKLVQQLEQKQEKAGRFYDAIVFTIGLLLIMGITYTGMHYIASNALIQYLTGHKAACFFILLIFISIRLLDSYLAKWKMQEESDK